MACSSSSSSSSFHFNGFEVLVLCPNDHRFYDKPKNLGLSARKRIAKEWKMLDKDEWKILEEILPRGTPYHDGLFFFDLQFPPDYPNSPPEVRYRSHGMRINRNISEDGELCLSLLNTWDGSPSEMWDPSNSTVLQVLVSVHGLVLTSDPYGSPIYTEEVFVISCKTAHFLFGKRPQGFEELVLAHYRDRSSTILEACRAYWSGTVGVGLYGSAVTPSTSASTHSEVSDEFKMDVREVYDLLVKAFLENSIEVGEDLVEYEVKKKEQLSGCGNIIQWFRRFFRSKKF